MLDEVNREFALLPPQRTSSRDIVRMIMESEYAAVIKVKECPVCGATNRVMYGFNEVIVDGACSFCGSMVRWKRKVPVSGGLIRAVLEDSAQELVPLDQYDQVGELQ